MDEEKLIRKHREREECEIIARKVNEHPARSYLEREINATNCGLESINESLVSVDAKILKRTQQFEDLMNAIAALQSEIVLEGESMELGGAGAVEVEARDDGDDDGFDDNNDNNNTDSREERERNISNAINNIQSLNESTDNGQFEEVETVEGEAIEAIDAAEPSEAEPNEVESIEVEPNEGEPNEGEARDAEPNEVAPEVEDNVMEVAEEEASAAQAEEKEA
jgi:hypothetical protein